MPIPPTDVPAVAAQLDDDSLHVWRLSYDAGRRRAPLVALLGSYLGVPPDAVQLVEGPHGRPHLAPALTVALSDTVQGVVEPVGNACAGH